MQKKLDADTKLMDLSCPFTWQMENAIENQHKLLGTKDDRFEMTVDKHEFLPEYCCVYRIMLAYECATNADPSDAMQYVIEAEQIFDDIKRMVTLRDVENALQHIFVATKCHVLQKLGQLTEVNEQLKRICDIQDMNNAELAMLSGCQCHAWSLYFVTDNLKAINCAKEAIDLDPDNSKWYYLLSKNSKRLRKMQSIFVPPKSEIIILEKAYELSKSKNVLIAASLAGSYLDSRNNSKAKRIYKELYDLQPTCCSIRLQLAKGFIQLNEPKLAKHCLEYVGKNMPDSVTYTHYMGMYEEKCNKDRKAALRFYKSTTERLNSGAERQYMKCKKAVEPDWDPLPYMLNLIKKYEKDSPTTRQRINMEIGLYYLFKLDDILSACQYLTDAIEIEPNAKQLQEYSPLFSPSLRVNIYHALTEKIQYAISKLENTLQLCRTNVKD